MSLLHKKHISNITSTVDNFTIILTTYTNFLGFTILKFAHSYAMSSDIEAYYRLDDPLIAWVPEEEDAIHEASIRAQVESIYQSISDINSPPKSSSQRSVIKPTYIDSKVAELKIGTLGKLPRELRDMIWDNVISDNNLRTNEYRMKHGYGHREFRQKLKRIAKDRRARAAPSRQKRKGSPTSAERRASIDATPEEDEQSD